MAKCDDCVHLRFWNLGLHECGTGNVVDYCSKGHWEYTPRTFSDEEIVKEDPWEGCFDFERE